MDTAISGLTVTVHETSAENMKNSPLEAINTTNNFKEENHFSFTPKLFVSKINAMDAKLSYKTACTTDFFYNAHRWSLHLQPSMLVGIPLYHIPSSHAFPKMLQCHSEMVPIFQSSHTQGRQ